MNPDSSLRTIGALCIVTGGCLFVAFAAAISPLNRTEKLPILIAPVLMIVGGCAACRRAGA